jgi:hypothetical protein
MHARQEEFKGDASGEVEGGMTGDDRPRAVCSKCGQEVSLNRTPNGFSYTLDRASMVDCPILKERLETKGPPESNPDCDHMREGVQSLTDRLRGTVGSQSTS